MGSWESHLDWSAKDTQERATEGAIVKRATEGAIVARLRATMELARRQQEIFFQLLEGVRQLPVDELQVPAELTTDHIGQVVKACSDLDAAMLEAEAAIDRLLKPVQRCLKLTRP